MRTITNLHDRHLILLARGEIRPGVVTIDAVRRLFAALNGIPPQWVQPREMLKCAISAFVTCFGADEAAMDDAFAGMFGYDDNVAGWQKSIDVEDLILFLVGRLALAQDVDCGVPDPQLLEIPLASPALTAA